MKKLFLCVLCALLRLKSSAAEGRVITENGTNIFAVGIDSRDFEIVRFYLKGTNVLEFRADDIAHKGRPVFAPVSTNDTERATLRAALKTAGNSGNIPPGQTSDVLLKLIRLHELDETDFNNRGLRVR